MGDPELGLGIVSGRAGRIVGKITAHGNRAKNRKKRNGGMEIADLSLSSFFPPELK